MIVASDRGGYRYAWVVVLVAGVLVLSGVMALDRRSSERHQLALQSQTLGRLSAMRARLEGGVNLRLHLAKGVVVQVILDPELDGQRFQRLAQLIQDRQPPGVLALHLARRGVVSHVFPMSDHETLLGSNLSEHPQLQGAVARALATRQTVIAGPVAWRPGEAPSLVALAPIYLPGAEEGPDSYWGLIVVPIDPEVLFREAGLMDPALGLIVALRGKDALGDRGGFLFGPEALFRDSPVRMPVTLPEGSWQLAAQPSEGWESDSFHHAGWWRMGALGLVVLTMALVRVVMRIPARLVQAVTLATRQLASTNQRLQEEIAERVEAERALAASEGRFLEVFRAAGDPFLLLDRGVIVDCNPAAAGLLGYDRREALIGQTPAALSPAQQPGGHDSRERASRMVELARERGGIQFEWVHLTADQQTCTVEVTLTPVLLGGRSMLHAIWKDIRDRLHREEVRRRYAEELEAKVQERTRLLMEVNARLHQEVVEHMRTEDTLRKLSMAVEYSPATVVITDTRGVIEYVNAKFVELSGYSPEEVIGRTTSVLKSGLTPPETYQGLWTALSAGREWRGDFINRRRNGEHYWEHALVAPVFNHEGQTTHFVAVKEDITWQKKAEESLRQAKESAEAANRAKSEFLSRMSHELRTPLNAILGFGEMVLSDLEAPPSEDHRDSLEQIVLAGRHLLGLINEVLDLARIESGRIEMHLGEVVFGELLEACLALIGPLAARFGVTLAPCGVSGAWPHPIADEMRLKQVVINLLSNAIKYNRRGGEVRLACRLTEEGRFRWEVCDTGPGIPASRQSEIFEPFNRLAAVHGAVEGTGIGLTISRQLMGLMNGAIGYVSREGEGSTFWIELPVAEREARMAGGHGVVEEGATSLAEGFGRSERVILCVEDSPPNLLLIQKIIDRMAGVRLLTASSAEEGLALADQHHLDLILMDINLPGMDGFEALARLRREERWQKVPVVALSAGAMPQLVSQAREVGFTDYLTKPIEIKRLVAVVEALLGRS